MVEWLQKLRFHTQEVNYTFEPTKESKINAELIILILALDKRPSLENENLKTFLRNFQKIGFTLEIVKSKANDSFLFIKICAYKMNLQMLSYEYNIGLTCDSARYTPIVSANSTIKTILTNTLPESLEPTNESVTDAEAILITYHALSITPYGSSVFEVGIERLIQNKLITDCYPLHDGPWQYNDLSLLSTRQLLSKFWASPKAWYRKQPLNLVEQYFGTETSFYFAWLGFYNKMLIPLALIGIVCFIYGLATLRTHMNRRSEEICKSNAILCPTCYYKLCQYTFLKSSCIYANISYILENEITMVYACLTAIWATLFIELWKRKQAVLQCRWNVSLIGHGITNLRPEFMEKAQSRVSDVTGLPELYISLGTHIFHYVVTYSSIILLIITVIAGLVSVIMYRLFLTLALMKNKDEVLSKQSTDVLITGSATALNVIFIIIYSQLYDQVAIFLTKQENPRTQFEFDDSYLYKCYILAFVINYTIPFYIAFFKGRFYTFPGDHLQHLKMAGIQGDRCDPTGCIADLGIELASIIIGKYILGNITEAFSPAMRVYVRKRKFNENTNILPQWEDEFALLAIDRNFFTTEYIEMVIQYGFVIFFVAAFPLAPFLALLNNIAEVRIDACKIVRYHRRPIPRRQQGLRAWSGVLQAITYVGVVINAVVLAFTSQTVPREIYRYSTNYYLTGFVNSTLSEFDTGDYHENRTVPVKICFYAGYRNPPDHAEKYQHTPTYWYIVAIRFAMILIFEHIIFGFTALLSYAIPDTPYNVRVFLESQTIQRDKASEN